MKTILLFAALTFFFLQPVRAQNPDSVKLWKQQLEVAKSDSARAILYGKLMAAFINTQPEIAINYLFDAYSNADSYLYVSINWNIIKHSLVLISQHNVAHDSILLNRIKTFNPREPEKKLGILYTLAADGAFYRGMIEDATKYMVKAHEILDRTSYPDADWIKCGQLFNLSISQKQWKKAKEIADAAVPSYYKSYPPLYAFGKNYLLCNYFTWLSAVDSLTSSNLDSGLYYALKAKEAAPTVYHKAYMAGMIGADYFNMKKYDDALASIQEAIDGQYSIGNMVEYGRYLELKAEVLYEKGDFKQAIETSEKVTRVISFDVEANAYTGAFLNLSKSYSKIGDYKKALENREKYEQLNDSLSSEQSKRNITDMQTKYETDKKDKEIEVQKTQLSRQRIINFGAAGIATILVLFLAFVYRNNRQKQKANIELQAAKEKAEQSEKFKQQFLANMSHEIRTPMNAVMGMTELVLNSPLNDKQRKYLESVKSSSNNLLHIINDILDLSKIEAGKIELEQIDFSVRNVLEQVKDILRNKAAEKNLQLIATADATVPEVLIGDPLRLMQVLMNLAGNAIKFTEKGSVCITVTSAATSNLKLQTLNFSITDTGIGIPKEKLETIFESFSQAHSSDSRKYGGTGLGLTISKQFIELMGGELKVESVEGSGTTFSFELNLPVGSEENLLQQNSPGEIDGSILNGLQILLVDDNVDNRIVAHDLLQSKCDVIIVEATNGKEAIELLMQKDFDIVLMDVQMPVMDGYEATRQIRSQQSAIRNHDIPVIALTASVIRSDLDKCRAAGMNDYVPKPFKTSQLISAIAKLTGKEIIFKKQVVTNGIGTSHTSNFSSNTIDLSYLEEFCEGDKVRMKKYINIFLGSTPVMIEKLTAAMAENNFEEIASQLHAFKTKFVMMGMDDAKDLAMQTEMECRTNTPDFDAVKNNVSLIIKSIEIAVGKLPESV